MSRASAWMETEKLLFCVVGSMRSFSNGLQGRAGDRSWSRTWSRSRQLQKETHNQEGPRSRGASARRIAASSCPDGNLETRPPPASAQSKVKLFSVRACLRVCLHACVCECDGNGNVYPCAGCLRMHPPRRFLSLSRVFTQLLSGCC